MESKNMKTNQIHPLRNLRSVFATVRSRIEQQYAPLAQQQPRLLRLALNEAESVAWETGVPHLVFPTLALEKARDLAQWHASQRTILWREPALAFAA